MKPAAWYVVQPFVRTKKGRVDRGVTRQSHSHDAAAKLARRLVDSGEAIGAIAFACCGDLDSGEYDAPDIIARVGTTPGEEMDLPF